MKRAFWAAMPIGLVVCGLAISVASDTAGQDPPSSSERPGGADSRSGHVMVPMEGLIRPLGSVAEIQAMMVVVATPVREAAEYWVPMEPEQGVWSRWVLRVDEVLEGDVSVGDELVVGLPGGRMHVGGRLSIASGKLEGSLRPTEGDPTTLVEFQEFPRLRLERQELLFLVPYPKEDHWADADFWTIAGAEARFVVEPDGTLRSPLGDVLKDVPVRSELEGRRLPDVPGRRGSP